MSLHDEPFHEQTLDAQLDALAHGDDPAPDAPTSRAYRALAHRYASRAAHEAGAVARVRQRLAPQLSRPTAPAAQVQQESHARIAPESPHVLADYHARRVPPASRRRPWLRGVAAVLAVGLLLGSFLAVLHARQATPLSDGYSWRVVPSPNTPLAVNVLTGITVRTRTDAWAWGESNVAPGDGNSNPITQPLIEHWDGTQWRIVASPPTLEGGQLTDIVAIAADDAWAVGNQLTGGAENTNGGGLIEHWDGHAWTMQPDRVSSGGLSALAALSADDIWAVGASGEPAGTAGFIAHWDGHAWRAIAHPTPPDGVQFSAIAALASDDIWAGGTAVLRHAPVFEHWDGHNWHLVPSPSSPGGFGLLTGNSTLTAISAVSSDDIWAAGYVSPAIPIPNGIEPLFEHWDGHRWSVVSGPSVDASAAGIVALGPDDVWAVGTAAGGLDIAQQGQGLVEHWDGQSWSLIANPSPRPFTSLGGIARDPTIPGKLWIAGITGPERDQGDQLSKTKTLIVTNQ